MSELKVLSKKTITVNIQPGESLLIINKKKKLSPDSRITFAGENIIDIATKHSKRVDNSFMSLMKVYLTSFNPIRTIGSQCYDVISNYTGLSLVESEVKLKEILNNLSCSDTDILMKKFPFKLEAYEKQRVMFAIAFLIKPKLIILDDAIFKMEPKIKAYILKELEKLRRENNTSLIFISKKLDVVTEGVDIIAIMYKGTVIEFAKKDLILKDPIHPYTKYLLNYNSTLNFTENKTEIVSYIKNLTSTPRNGCSFCLHCSNASYDCVYMPPRIKSIGKERQVICNGA